MDEIFGPKFLELFDKLNVVITEKEKFDQAKQNLQNEIEKSKEKLKIIKSNAPSQSKHNSDIEQKEKELYLCLKSYKEESENLDNLKEKSKILKEKSKELENELSLIMKNIEEVSKFQKNIEKETKSLENQYNTTVKEIDINTIKYKELLDRYKEASQIQNLKKIEIENLLQKFNEIKKTKKVNRALLKNNEDALEILYKSLLNRNEEAYNLLNSYLDIVNNNEKLQILTQKYMDKVNENNKIREENENLKEKINMASVKNFQSKLQSFSPAKKRTSKEYDNEKFEAIRVNLEKVKHLIVDINIIQNKK